MNTDAKVLNNRLTNRIQQLIKEFRHHRIHVRSMMHIVNIIHHINKEMIKTHYPIKTCRKKHLMRSSFMRKSFNKIDVEGNFLNMVKVNDHNLTTRNILIELKLRLPSMIRFNARSIF